MTIRVNRPISLFLIAGLIAICILGGIFWWLNRSQSSDSTSMHNESLIDESTLKKLATIGTAIDLSHIDDNMAPPTNKWFSGFALQSQPKPGYNYPNSFLPTSNGFEFSLPKITATATAITGSHTADVTVSIENASSYKITRYDELVVELTYYNEANQAVATATVASGLPYVYVTAKQDTKVTFTGSARPEDSSTSIRSNDTLYGVDISTPNNQFSLSSGEHASFFSSPTDEAFAAIAAHAGAVVESAHVSYERQGSDFLTTFDYKTKQNKPVLFARLPHQQTNSDSKATYRSILGDMTTSSGNKFSFKTPRVPVSDKLDLGQISTEQRSLLVNQLRNDIARFEKKDDTYFGGKQLYRMAQLLTIAKQLGEDSLATTAQATLKQELQEWLTPGKREPKSFLYDPSVMGIVGNVASFGSDKEFNDHHFHYGYFIYAAAILSQYDKDFLNEHRKTINLLVADIANYNLNEKLPQRRSFDPYTGHSWASGTVPFKDGNNQESTSEAINAWVGVSLWSQQTNNTTLTLQADWILSQEYRTAQSYWLLRGEKLPSYAATYSSPIASIVWGGKREYATFFSDEPNAKLAIQLLPLSPTIKNLGETYPTGLFQGTAIDKPYGDSILMAGPDATVAQAQSLPDTAIDDGNSRTYLYAYIMSK